MPTPALGQHRISPERSYSVHRNSGLLTIFGTFAFATAILSSQGKIVSTPGWQPLLSVPGDYLTIGAVLMLSAILGVAGLAFEDDDRHRFPRILTLLSAAIGVLWFGTASVTFCFTWDEGWVNAGPFLAVPGAILHANRLWLLSEWPDKRL